MCMQVFNILSTIEFYIKEKFQWSSQDSPERPQILACVVNATDPPSRQGTPIKRGQIIWQKLDY